MYIPTWVIIVIAIGAFLYYLTRKKNAEFSPFRIQIQPNWYELLKDYKLINDDSWVGKRGTFMQSVPRMRLGVDGS